VAGSAYTYVYWSYIKTTNFFILPLFLVLNATMLIAVLVMRFVIKRTPNLLPNENLVLVHVLLFTVTTACWIGERWYYASVNKASYAYFANPTNENDVIWIYASVSYLQVRIAYGTVDILLNLFMLYMLHQFSNFTGFV